MSGLSALIQLYLHKMYSSLFPVAVRSKAWVCGGSVLGLKVRNPRGMDAFFLVTVVCCEVEVSGKSCLLVQRTPTVCDMS
jgi:hypothetical protein